MYAQQRKSSNKVQSTHHTHYLFSNNIDYELKKLSTKPWVPDENELQVWTTPSRDIPINNPKKCSVSSVNKNSNHIILFHQGQIILTSVTEIVTNVRKEAKMTVFFCIFVIKCKQFHTKQYRHFSHIKQ